MSTEIAPMQAVQDKIRDKIRGEFAELIPEEFWSAMVASVLREFTDDSRDRHGRPEEAGIKKMIRVALEEECQKQVKAALAETTVDWDVFGNKALFQATEIMIREEMPALITAVQEGMVRAMVDQAISQMRQGMGIY